MGEIYSRTYREGHRPHEIPAYNSSSTFDPEYGFKVPRKERVSQLSLQEMKALKIPKDRRDYCAHLFRDFRLCLNYFRPAGGMCKPEFHSLQHCVVEDRILRMKEYEREKRLRMREARKQKMAS